MNIFYRLYDKSLDLTCLENKISAGFVFVFENLSAENKVIFVDNVFGIKLNDPKSDHYLQGPVFDYEIDLKENKPWFGKLKVQGHRPDVGILIKSKKNTVEKKIYLLFENKVGDNLVGAMEQLQAIDIAFFPLKSPNTCFSVFIGDIWLPPSVVSLIN